MESLLVSNARHVRSINKFGMTKVMQNILALQQSLRTIGGGHQVAHFDRARAYYTLYSRGPQVSRTFFGPSFPDGLSRACSTVPTVAKLSHSTSIKLC